ncbi:MAG: hypothetical protein ABSC01_10045 [Verrucomicrobiota bacterium]|jgi:hypothetical protein
MTKPIQLSAPRPNEADFITEDELVERLKISRGTTHVPGAAEHFSESRRVELTGADGSPLAAGVTLYLPQKESAAVESSVETVPALTEGGESERD